MEEAQKYPWDARRRPEVFVPVQESRDMPCSSCDWWSTRSQILCCCFPCAKCISGVKTVDGTDHTIWKKQLEAPPVSEKCPDSMKGVWWLKYNTAHENLVAIFNETNFIGEVNEDGTEGFGSYEIPMKTNWTRDNSCFGYILAMNASLTNSKITGLYNLKDGILNIGGKQWIYKISDNEWWKVHYEGDLGEEGEKSVDYMYQWLKVIDKDGEPTEFWSEYVNWSKQELPHRNSCEPWFPCWPSSKKLLNQQLFQDMIRPNPKQIVMFRE